jgi:hypothetical protein
MGHCAWTWCLRFVQSKNKDLDTKIDLPTAATSLWNSVRQEMHLLCCTNDKKYTKLRKQLTSRSGKSQLTITAAIACFISTYVGIVPSTVLTPLCAIMLLAVLGLGKEVVCQRLLMPVTLKPYSYDNPYDHTGTEKIIGVRPADNELGLTLGEANGIRPQKAEQPPRSRARRAPVQKS